MNDVVDHGLAERMEVARERQAQILVLGQNVAHDLAGPKRIKAKSVGGAGKPALGKYDVECLRQIRFSRAMQQRNRHLPLAIGDFFRRQEELLHGGVSFVARSHQTDMHWTLGRSLHFVRIQIGDRRPDFLQHLERHTPVILAVNARQCT